MSNTVGGSTATPGTPPGNVISGNNISGVLLFDADNNSVQGNIVGLTAPGNVDIGNSNDGVLINGTSGTNTIGGPTTTPGTGVGNVISGNNSAGVEINGAGATGNSVLGNIIGLDIGGTVDLGNTGDGVRILDALNTTIGGTTSTARNIISGNSVGVDIEGVATANVIRGNFIGTSRDGTLDRGNSQNGVQIASSAGVTTISGSTATIGTAPGNVISGNFLNGIIINSDGHTVSGEYHWPECRRYGQFGQLITWRCDWLLKQHHRRKHRTFWEHYL